MKLGFMRQSYCNYRKPGSVTEPIMGPLWLTGNATLTPRFCPSLSPLEVVKGSTLYASISYRNFSSTRSLCYLGKDIIPGLVVTPAALLLTKEGFL
ncbi:hypothetical protein J6590_016524, partial [Homalodisca vitripennis]